MKQSVGYGIDSRYQNKKEREADSITLMESRLKRLKRLPKEQIIRAKLMQLKLLLFWQKK